jgi:hypothetical protein
MGFIGSCIDITDLKIAKINADKMAQAKTNFLANMRCAAHTTIVEFTHVHRTRTFARSH